MLHKIVNKYIEAWNSDDNSNRYLLLQQCFSQNGTFIDNSAENKIKSLNEMDFYIRSFRSRNKNKLKLTSEPDIHHNVFRLSWKIASDNENDISGIYVGEIENKEIIRIIGFING